MIRAKLASVLLIACFVLAMMAVGLFILTQPTAATQSETAPWRMTEMTHIGNGYQLRYIQNPNTGMCYALMQYRRERWATLGVTMVPCEETDWE